MSRLPNSTINLPERELCIPILNKLSTLIPELEKIREHGYAIDNIEYNKEVRYLSAPVFNRNNQIIEAIAITASTTNFQKSRIPKIARHVINTSKKLTHLLQTT